MKRMILAIACLTGLAGLVGCDKEDNATEMDVLTMRKGLRYETQTTSDFFKNGMSARPAIEHTVLVDPITEVRPPVTAAVLERGHQRFEIYCNECHGNDGYGQGMVVRHGFPQPPSFHSDRVRGLTDEHIYSLISNGLGKMPPYADQIPPADRWAIVSYVRALQRSQHATIADVPAEAQKTMPVVTVPGGEQ